MTNLSSNNQELNPFGKLLSLLALLAVALYFTGWIYRWAYFDFFQVESITLNLPFESFYFAAFQVLFGHPFSIIRTIGAIFMTGLASIIALSLRQRITNWFLNKRLLPASLTSTRTLRFLNALTDEFIIVLLIVTTLFWVARWQARTDAWKDAVNETSSLPVVTVVIPNKEGAGLGRQANNPLVNPSGFRIIGDQNLYNRLLGQELTNTDDPDKQRVWRLLLDRNGYFYIFPALPKKDRFLNFPVLIIYESSNQLVILSPDVSD